MRLSRGLAGAVVFVLLGWGLSEAVGSQGGFQGEREGIRIGEVLTLSSKVLGGDRKVSLWLPPGYEEGNARYPVLYVLDGEFNFSLGVTAIEFLSRYGRIPSMIVVGVHNQGRRRIEMTPSKMSLDGIRGEGEKFLDFLEEELIPAVDQKFRTVPSRVLHGHSHGAILGTYSLAARPHLFRWGLMLDMPSRKGGSFLESSLIESLSRSEKRFGRLVSVERKFGWVSEDWGRLEEVAPEGYFLDRFHVPDETHETMLYEGTYEGLKRLYFDYATKEVRTKTLSQLKAQYEARSEAYGYPVSIPKSLVEVNIFDWLVQQRGREAKELADFLAERFGQTRGHLWDQETIRAVLEAGPLRESVEVLLASKSPQPSEVAEFLGTWEGICDLPHPMPLRVRFKVEGEEVVVRTWTKLPDRDWGEGTESAVVRRRSDGALEWGFYNNMRPFCLMMYSALPGTKDTLVGKMGLRGATLKFLRPGKEMSSHRISLRRSSF